jgi:hypothetical protein
MNPHPLPAVNVGGGFFIVWPVFPLTVKLVIVALVHIR